MSLHRFDQSGLAPGACHVVLESWAADSITWNNAPGFDSLNPVSQIETDEKWITFEVTEAVTNSHQNPERNFGFLLMRSNNTDTKLICHSSEYPDVAMRPKLSITFSDANPIVHHPGKTDLSAKEQFRVQQNNGTISLFLPWSGVSSIALFDVRGRKTASFRSDASFTWIQLPQKLSSGKYLISVGTPAINVIKKILVFR